MLGREWKLLSQKSFWFICDFPCPIREPAPQAQLPVGWGPAPNQALEWENGRLFPYSSRLAGFECYLPGCVPLTFVHTFQKTCLSSW